MCCLERMMKKERRQNKPWASQVKTCPPHDSPISSSRATRLRTIRCLCPAAGIKKERPKRIKKYDAARPSYGRVSMRYNPIDLGRQPANPPSDPSMGCFQILMHTARVFVSIHLERLPISPASLWPSKLVVTGQAWVTMTLDKIAPRTTQLSAFPSLSYSIPFKMLLFLFVRPLGHGRWA